LTQHPQRQGHVLERRQMIEQPELLEDNADMPAHLQQAILRQIADILAKHRHLAA
jgi:hypothetical protein